MVHIPPTQRAWVVRRRGPPSKALKFKQEWPVHTKLAKDTVLVKIEAAALNPLGYKLMRVLPNIIAGRPLVAEYDFTGVIADGNDTEFTVGDAVFGFMTAAYAKTSKQGSLAEYAAVPVTSVVRRPPNIDILHAAGISLAGQAAYQALFRHAKLEPGQTVLINGGSSAVGLSAIQIAKARGLKVVTTASAKNEGFVNKMGADEFIDYTAEPLHEYLTAHPPEPKFHAIIDAVGLSDPSLYVHSPGYLAPQGAFVSTGPMPHSSTAKEFFNVFKTAVAMFRPVWLGGVNRPYIIFNVSENKADLEALRDMVADGKVRGAVDSVYPFEDALKAYERLMTAKATGKVVVKIDEDVKLQ
ncbi:hypothetical protein ONZ45_g18205 [Pleurotus djamor]|nr:hypothetical protein ONZ45_g18205 [Pleurotus djamor]